MSVLQGRHGYETDNHGQEGVTCHSLHVVSIESYYPRSWSNAFGSVCLSIRFSVWMRNSKTIAPIDSIVLHKKYWLGLLKLSGTGLNNYYTGMDN